MTGKNPSAQAVGAIGADAQLPHLRFLLAHIDPRFADDTNTDVGPILIALAYPHIIVIGASPKFLRRDVDVSQPGFHVEADCYPLKQFLERFPHLCQQIVERHVELLGIYKNWRDVQR
jgi:hypothetical protein